MNNNNNTFSNLLTHEMHKYSDSNTSIPSWVINAVKNKITKLKFRFYNIQDWVNLEELNKKILPRILEAISLEQLSYNGHYLNYDSSNFEVVSSKGLKDNELSLRLKYESMYFNINVSLESDLKIVTNNEITFLLTDFLTNLSQNNSLIYNSLQLNKSIIKESLTSWITKSIEDNLEKITINSIPLSKLQQTFEIKKLLVLSINFYKTSETNEISFTLIYDTFIAVPIKITVIPNPDLKVMAIINQLNNLEIIDVILGSKVLDAINNSASGLLQLLVNKNISNFDLNKFKLENLYNSENHGDIVQSNDILIMNSIEPTKIYYFKYNYANKINDLYLPIKITAILKPEDLKVMKTINQLKDLEIVNVISGSKVLDAINNSANGLLQLLVNKNINDFDLNKFKLENFYNSENHGNIVQSNDILITNIPVLKLIILNIIMHIFLMKNMYL